MTPLDLPKPLQLHAVVVNNMVFDAWWSVGQVGTPAHYAAEAFARIRLAMETDQEELADARAKRRLKW